MKEKLTIIITVIAFLGFIPTTFIFAQETNLEEALASLQQKIEELKAQILQLQEQLIVLEKTEKELIRFTKILHRGIRDKEVEELQSFLKQFPDIYPEGLVTGYFGTLTEKAVQRLQEKHGIVNSGTPETTGYGQVGPKTIEKLHELVIEGAGKSGVIPPGLLTAPGLHKESTTTPATTTPSTATTTPSGTVPAEPATPATPPGGGGGGATPATPATPAIPTHSPIQTPTPLPFSDNFNDENADGWIAAMPLSVYSREPATWRVENQQVINTPLLTSGDNYKFLLDNYSLSSLSVEAKILFYGSGYGGLTIWHHDLDNWVDIVGYPAGLGKDGKPLMIIQAIDGLVTTTKYPYIWWTTGNGEGVWTDMKVLANGDTGMIDVYVNNQHAITYQTQVVHRDGLSGFNSGNGGGAFDDFKLDSNPSPPSPEPLISYNFEVIRIMDDSPRDTAGIDDVMFSKIPFYAWSVTPYKPTDHMAVVDDTGTFYDLELTTGKVTGPIFSEPVEWANISGVAKGHSIVYVPERDSFFVVNSVTAKIYEVKTSGAIVNSFSSSAVVGITYHADRGTLFLASLGTWVNEMSLDGNLIKSHVIDFGDFPSFKNVDVAYDSFSKNIFVAGAWQPISGTDKAYAGIVLNPYTGATIAKYSLNLSPGSLSFMSIDRTNRHLYTTGQGDWILEFAPK